MTCTQNLRATKIDSCKWRNSRHVYTRIRRIYLEWFPRFLDSLNTCRTIENTRQKDQHTSLLLSARRVHSWVPSCKILVLPAKFLRGFAWKMASCLSVRPKTVFIDLIFLASTPAFLNFSQNKYSSVLRACDHGDHSVFFINRYSKFSSKPSFA